MPTMQESHTHSVDSRAKPQLKISSAAIVATTAATIEIEAGSDLVSTLTKKSPCRRSWFGSRASTKEG